jgi:hypothetical protein
VGSCLYLDGDAAYAEIPLNYSQFPDQMSLSVWFKHEVAPYTTVWTSLFECNNGEQKDLFSINQEAYSASAQFIVMLQGGKNSLYVVNNGFPPGTWVHYVWTLKKLDEQGNAKWGIFKDGAYLASTYGYYPVHTQTCYMGKTAGNLGTPFFEGRIDTFAFYPHILTSEEVQLVYRATGPVVRLAINTNDLL